ncbi:MAG: ASCH domain-containing protein [Phycisphaerales bacterium]|nr:ASCH domain-containing protein [Phycisphaerales bacterium]
MKAISLWQPWTQLVALGLKKFETRSWSTNYRGPLAIHAAKRKDHGILSACKHPLIAATLAKCGINSHEVLPFGAIVCVVDLVQVYQVRTIHGIWGIKHELWSKGSLRNMPTGDELAFGDFTTGRYAWLLENVYRIPPIDYKGQQNLWDLDTKLSNYLLMYKPLTLPTDRQAMIEKAVSIDEDCISAGSLFERGVA